MALNEGELRGNIAKINDLRRRLEVYEARLDELEIGIGDKAVAEGRRLQMNKRMNELATIVQGLKDEIEKLKAERP